MRHLAFVLLGGVLLSSPACGRQNSVAAPQEVVRNVSATRVPGGIRLVNDTSEPIAYLVWNREWLGLLAQCIDTSSNCLRLAAGDTVTVADKDIEGYGSGIREAVVRFWRVVPDGKGSYRAEDLREITIQL